MPGLPVPLPGPVLPEPGAPGVPVPPGLAVPGPVLPIPVAGVGAPVPGPPGLGPNALEPALAFGASPGVSMPLGSTFDAPPFACGRVLVAVSPPEPKAAAAVPLLESG